MSTFFFLDLAHQFLADQREALEALLGLSFLRKGFAFPPPTRPASIRTLGGAVGSGASWSPQSQIGCCHLSIELSRSVSGDARSTATSQSPELGDGLQNYILLGGLLLRRLAVAQRLVHFRRHPQPVQQHRQLPGHRHDRALLRILAAAFGQLQPPPFQIRIRTAPA